MSDFQLALLAAGIAVVGCVWGYNSWQERKHRKIAQRLFKGEQPDALLGEDDQRAAPSSPNGADLARDGRIEPGLSVEDEPSAGGQSEFPTDGPVSDSDTPAMAGAVRVEEDEFAPHSDPLIDCLVKFELAEPVSASAVWAVQSLWSGHVSKSLRWLARSSAVEPWRLISQNDSGRSSRWLVALQLADRRGAVTDNELAVFLDGMQQLSAQLGVDIALPGRTETLRRAQELDAFCASVDIQFSLHLVDAQGGSFAGTKLRGVFEAAGLVLQDDGCFHARNVNGASEFWVANIGSERFEPQSIRSLATHGITLTLDVPRVADGVQAFDRMVAAARQFERGLGGKLVDMQRAPLADAMIRGIRGKTGELQKALLDAGIAPGGTRAMKLFS